MKKIINYLLVFVVFISVTSCFSYKEVEIKQVESVRVLSMNDSTADVEVALKINNPNKMKIIVKDYNLEAFINKKYVGKVDCNKKLVLNKKSENTYTLLLKADMAQVKKLLPSLAFNNHALLSIKGDLKVKAKGISKSFKIDRTEKIARKDLKNVMMANNGPL
jgi:LEA14-like dessication related protein